MIKKKLRMTRIDRVFDRTQWSVCSGK